MTSWITHNEKWKCVNFMCYSSEELITLNTLHEVVPTWYSFHSWVDWSNADKVSCSRRKHIDAGDWIVNLCIQNRHSNHYTNCSHTWKWKPNLDSDHICRCQIFVLVSVHKAVCRCCEISAQYNTRKVIDGMVRLIVMQSYRQTFVVVSNAFFCDCTILG